MSLLNLGIIAVATIRRRFRKKRAVARRQLWLHKQDQARLYCIAADQNHCSAEQLEESPLNWTYLQSGLRQTLDLCSNGSKGIQTIEGTILEMSELQESQQPHRHMVSKMLATLVDLWGSCVCRSALRCQWPAQEDQGREASFMVPADHSHLAWRPMVASTAKKAIEKRVEKSESQTEKRGRIRKGSHAFTFLSLYYLTLHFDGILCCANGPTTLAAEGLQCERFCWVQQCSFGQCRDGGSHKSLLPRPEGDASTNEGNGSQIRGCYKEISCKEHGGNLGELGSHAREAQRATTSQAEPQDGLGEKPRRNHVSLGGTRESLYHPTGRICTTDFICYYRDRDHQIVIGRPFQASRRPAEDRGDRRLSGRESSRGERENCTQEIDVSHENLRGYGWHSDRCQLRGRCDGGEGWRTWRWTSKAWTSCSRSLKIGDRQTCLRNACCAPARIPRKAHFDTKCLEIEADTWDGPSLDTRSSKHDTLHSILFEADCHYDFLALSSASFLALEVLQSTTAEVIGDFKEAVNTLNVNNNNHTTCDPWDLAPVYKPQGSKVAPLSTHEAGS